MIKNIMWNYIIIPKPSSSMVEEGSYYHITHYPQHIVDIMLIQFIHRMSLDICTTNTHQQIQEIKKTPSPL
jgi:hypothetical protein